MISLLHLYTYVCMQLEIHAKVHGGRNTNFYKYTINYIKIVLMSTNLMQYNYSQIFPIRFEYSWLYYVIV